VKVVVSPRALDDLDAMHRYISEESYESRADAYIQRIEAYCMRLSTFPFRGRPHDEVLPGLRTVGFEGRITIAYTVIGERLTIEGVFYGGRAWEGRFRSD